MTSMKLDACLVDEDKKVFTVRTGTEAVHVALREFLANHRFKKLMAKHRGKLRFEGYGD